MEKIAADFSLETTDRWGYSRTKWCLSSAHVSVALWRRDAEMRMIVANPHSTVANEVWPVLVVLVRSKMRGPCRPCSGLGFLLPLRVASVLEKEAARETGKKDVA